MQRNEASLNAGPEALPSQAVDEHVKSVVGQRECLKANSNCAVVTVRQDASSTRQEEWPNEVDDAVRALGQHQVHGQT